MNETERKREWKIKISNWGIEKNDWKHSGKFTEGKYKIIKMWEEMKKKGME